MAGIACVMLFWLSVPRFMAALAAVPGDHTVFTLTYSPPAGEPALQRLVDSRMAAQAWTADPAHDREIARAQIILAYRAGYRTEEGQSLLEAVEEDTLAALARAPGDPETWARLAEARYWTGRPTASILEAYRNSILTGHHAPHIAERRIRLGLALWNRMSAEDRRHVTGQIQLLAATGNRSDMELLARLSNSKRRYTLIVLALLQQPQWLAEFKRRRGIMKIEPPFS